VFRLELSRFVWVCGLLAGAVTSAVTTRLGAEGPVLRSSHHAAKKELPGVVSADPVPLLATLAQTHTGERIPLDAHEPSQAHFSNLLADRVTGSHTELAPELLGLLRIIASHHPAARIELVSGFRSPKLNEMLRKKGHHVASHSQHSLGHACDFRVIPAGTEVWIQPRLLETEIRATGWKGGVGIYPSKDDGFVHADVGPNRRWLGK
jgi:uncharacterized protein YcbK (DUF882 family)